MSKLSNSILGVAASLTMISGAIAPANVMAWGDSQPGGRPSYTLDQINDDVLGNTITFNSISNGTIGNEKNFVGARLTGAEGKWSADTLKVEDGKTYTIRLYVHNNNPEGTDAVAKDVTTTFAIPNTVAKSHNIVGYIDSTNATPDRYWDEVELVSDEDFYIDYVEGSAKYETYHEGDLIPGGNGQRESVRSVASLPDEVITSGAKIGYDALDGNIPGCFKYEGMVTIDVTIRSAVSTTIKQSVRVKGEKTWHDVVAAKVGQEVEYKIVFTNNSSVPVYDVMLRDALPDNIEYIPGTTILGNAVYPEGVKIPDTLTTTGVNIGNYLAKDFGEVYFSGKVVNKSLKDCGAINSLENWVASTVNGKVAAKDNTVVNVQLPVECPTPDPEPDPEPEPEPEPEPKKTCETNPEMEGCKKIPDTGANNIVVAALGAGAMVTALGYYIASRKKLM